MNNIPRFVYFVWTSPGNRPVSRQFAGRMQKRAGGGPGGPPAQKKGGYKKKLWVEQGFFF